jgi:dCTP deaminase
MLSGSQICERVFAPSGLSIGEMLDASQFQPASVDLTLGPEVYIPEYDEHLVADPGEPIELGADAFVLGHVEEHVSVPPDLLGLLSGRSTLARQGIAVHLVAGWCDPGSKGQLVLEIKNVAADTRVLHPGDRVAQIGFITLDEPAEVPYGAPDRDSHYQGQTGAQPPVDEQ